MTFLYGLLIFNMLVLGANFCFLLIGGYPFRRGKEHAPVHFGHKTFSVELFAVGISVSVLGLSWLVAWVYFLVQGWDSFVAQFNFLLLHVVLQFLSAVALMVAGIAIFRKWRRFKGIFLTSMATLIGSIFLALLVYGPTGHGESVFMYLFGVWTLVVGGVFTTAVYFLDRLLHDWDENLRGQS